jgi:hypothetical protein
VFEDRCIVLAKLLDEVCRDLERIGHKRIVPEEGAVRSSLAEERDFGVDEASGYYPRRAEGRAIKLHECAVHQCCARDRYLAL